MDDPTYPNNIEEGYIKTINSVDKATFNKPKVGERFLITNGYSYFISSRVREIISDNIFKTLNSIYEWNIIEDDK